MKSLFLVLLMSALFPAYGIAVTISETRAKLKLAMLAFDALNYDLSENLFNHWQYGNGSSKRVQPKDLNNRYVKAHLESQQAEIIAAVQRDLGRGKYRINSTQRVIRTNSMKRPKLPTDFTFAIGGCTFDSYADVKIGKPDKRGKVSCEIKKWSSILEDRFLFDYKDSFTLPSENITLGFADDELANYARKGYAKDFDVRSSSFYFDNLLDSFNVTITVIGQG